MPSFPEIRSGSAALYPMRRARIHGTTVIRFVDDTEQRWRSSPPMMQFVLEYRDINGYDLSRLLEFFRTVKGRFDTTWDITVGGVTYHHMMFDGDAFEVVESKPDRYTVRLTCRQWRRE